MMYEILDHRTNVYDVHIDDAFIIYSSGRKTWHCTNKSWFLFVRWNHGSYSWVDLKGLKFYNPVEVAYYTSANKLVSVPAFSWWVPNFLEKKKSIIAVINGRIKKHTYKYGFEVPTTDGEEYALDKNNIN